MGDDMNQSIGPRLLALASKHGMMLGHAGGADMQSSLFVFKDRPMSVCVQITRGEAECLAAQGLLEDVMERRLTQAKQLQQDLEKRVAGKSKQ